MHTEFCPQSHWQLDIIRALIPQGARRQAQSQFDEVCSPQGLSTASYQNRFSNARNSPFCNSPYLISAEKLLNVTTSAF